MKKNWVLVPHNHPGPPPPQQDVSPSWSPAPPSCWDSFVKLLFPSQLLPCLLVSRATAWAVRKGQRTALLGSRKLQSRQQPGPVPAVSKLTGCPFCPAQVEGRLILAWPPEPSSGLSSSCPFHEPRLGALTILCMLAAGGCTWLRRRLCRERSRKLSFLLRAGRQGQAHLSSGTWACALGDGVGVTMAR